jgi:hypothetical protein
MTQTKLGSFIEAFINVLIGFGINFCANLLVLPLFGFNVTIHDNLIIGGIFTVISVVRSYCVRRWFNARLHNLALRMAGQT